jgi:hypothetical protein
MSLPGPDPEAIESAHVLPTGQASSGLLGSPVFARAGKTDPPSSSHPLAVARPAQRDIAQRFRAVM